MPPTYGYLTFQILLLSFLASILFASTGITVSSAVRINNFCWLSLTNILKIGLSPVSDLWVRSNNKPYNGAYPVSCQIGKMMAALWVFGGAPKLVFPLQQLLCCWLSQLLWLLSCFSRLLHRRSRTGQVKPPQNSLFLLGFSSCSWTDAPWIVARLWLISRLSEKVVFDNFTSDLVSFIEKQNV